MAKEGPEEPKMEEREWFTIPEAADYLEVSEPTIYRWMKEGKLSFYKLGDGTRFRKENLDMIFEKHTGHREANYYGSRCVACGHSHLIPGRVQSTGNVYFKPAKARFFALMENLVQLDARVCPRCGFVQLFGSTDRLNKLLPDAEKVPAGEEER